MGTTLEHGNFRQEDYALFRRRLDDNLDMLQHLLAQPGFGQGPASFGAELELYLIDQAGLPLGINRELQALADNPLITLELNRFNLEYNLAPVAMDAAPFRSTETRLLLELDSLNRHAATLGGRVVPIGILPTLDYSHFGPQAMTDTPRYHALKKILNDSRGGPFRVQINGQDELLLETDDITFEGANTSFQIHYRVAPDAYADLYNACQLVTPLVLAAGANSPTAFGRRLWHETRIPLFKKSIDARRADTLDRFHWHQPPRVNFGNGWLRHGVHELFAESVYLYPVLLPLLADETPRQQLDAGKVPALSELRLHQGTVWLWNRPVYDAAAGGHLRIELRSLPSGPTPIDMLANAALAIGLAEGLRDGIDALLTALPFHIANQNFYRAAREGLDASLVWPQPAGSRLQETPVRSLLAQLLPVADDGLQRIGIAAAERARYLGVIAQRLDRNCNGARWQLDCCARFEATMDRESSLQAMLALYLAHAQRNEPVASWELP